MLTGSASEEANGPVVEVDTLTVNFGRLKAVEEVSLSGVDGRSVRSGGRVRVWEVDARLLDAQHRPAPRRDHLGRRCATGAGT